MVSTGFSPIIPIVALPSSPLKPGETGLRLLIPSRRDPLVVRQHENTYGSAPTDADFDLEPDLESGSSLDDDDPDPDSEDDPDPHSNDDPNPEFVSDLDPDLDFDFDFDSGPDSSSDSDPNSYSTCILCIFRCTDYDF
ncbi:hypothetical protein L3X38_012389 [Prunus dulcis]|uniref:Uncharacterized protein n=1 Tax=Prunus dulcis TaxID=3755 RepID=A0AAD4ZF64_PRUDU|nr:hypothetical protein L3X38_012389 [Prunus dulcis]